MSCHEICLENSSSGVCNHQKMVWTYLERGLNKKWNDKCDLTLTCEERLYFGLFEFIELMQSFIDKDYALTYRLFLEPLTRLVSRTFFKKREWACLMLETTRSHPRNFSPSMDCRLLAGLDCNKVWLCAKLNQTSGGLNCKEKYNFFFFLKKLTYELSHLFSLYLRF